MFVQTMHYLVDLYFVGQLGDAAIAGLGSAGNVQFLVMAITQVLGVGTMALIAQAAGKKDREDANLIFNQSLVLAAVCRNDDWAASIDALERSLRGALDSGFSDAEFERQLSVLRGRSVSKDSLRLGTSCSCAKLLY